LTPAAPDQTLPGKNRKGVKTITFNNLHPVTAATDNQL
jgi:hypothetical protein